MREFFSRVKCQIKCGKINNILWDFAFFFFLSMNTQAVMVKLKNFNLTKCANNSAKM